MKKKNTRFLILFIFSFLLYSNTLKHEYVLDDFSVIKENFVVKKGLKGIPEIWKTHYRYGYGFQKASLYRPLSLSLFAIQWEFAPDEPNVAHFINVLLYSILVVLIYFFLLQLFSSENWLLAFLSSLLFAAHPIHTEVVANIKSIDDILVFTLCLLAFLLIFKYLRTNKILYLLISLILMGLSFFTKESTVTLVACLPFILVLFFKVSWKKSIAISALSVLPFSIYLYCRSQVLGSLNGTAGVDGLDNILVNAPNVFIRIATALKIMGLYIYKTVIPHPLVNDYSMNQITLNGFENPFSILSLLLYLGLIITILKLWHKNKILSFGILFFLVNFSLYTNLFITIGTSFGERLLFIPSLGFAICLAVIFVKIFTKTNNPQNLKKYPLLIASIGIILGLYSFKTINRNPAWKNNFSLYTTDLSNCEESARCQYHYGLAIMKNQAMTAKTEIEKKKYLNISIQAFNKSVQIHPNYSEAHADLGLAYFRLNQFTKAERNYLRATELNQGNATAYSNLGSLYFNTQRYKLAKSSYEKALEINPNHVDALSNYASTLGTLGDYQGAIQNFKKAIELNPNEANYYHMVGITYKNLGKQTLANQYFQQAKALK